MLTAALPGWGPGAIGFGVLLVIILVVIWMVRLRSQRRRRDWQEVAEKLNLTYAEADPDLQGRYAFDLFAAGDSRCGRNVLTGTVRGTTITLADYTFRTLDVDTYNRHNVTLCILAHDDLDLPPMIIRLAVHLTGVTAAIANKLGVPEDEPDIEFESDPSFGEEFNLQCRDEEAARQAMSPEIRKFFMANKDRFRRAIIETGGNAVMAVNIDPRLLAAVKMADAVGAPSAVGEAGRLLDPLDAMALMELAFDLQKAFTGPR